MPCVLVEPLLKDSKRYWDSFCIGEHAHVVSSHNTNGSHIKNTPVK